ncbi:DUF3800 domain-containing protein [Mycobacterium sp. D16R24]|uniref:DUF3800 domain-containing protein n=1 Tax=Mycobacterium sp. D16R24 TaxID=1855656 RepID=UPI000993C7F4|nr:DUF3800 domain-containing protein [Mycobacterium sp. D16R24]
MRKYLFSDESGDLQCRADPNVSRFFAVGSLFVTESELIQLRSAMSSLRDELAWSSHGLDSAFHATTDKQYVRDEVFEVLRQLNFRFDVTLLEKRKSQAHIRSTEEMLYKYAWYYHLKYHANQMFRENDEALIVAAELGTRKKRQAFREAIEDVMTQCLPYRVKRALAFWRDESDFALQAVDYLTWAVTRFYERGDARSFELIQGKVNSTFDLFKWGTQYYF